VRPHRSRVAILVVSVVIVTGCDMFREKVTITGSVRRYVTVPMSYQGIPPDEPLPGAEIRVYPKEKADLYEAEMKRRENRFRASRDRAEMDASINEYSREGARRLYELFGKPHANARCNPDGHYSITVAKDSGYFLTASASELINGKEYTRYWFLPATVSSNSIIVNFRDDNQFNLPHDLAMEAIRGR
jgi:hypothetical protein